MRRRAARIDANHVEVVQALRKVGYSVLSLASLGKGCPDLLVGGHGVNLLMEVKDGKKPPSARALTDDELTFLENWRGLSVVVTSIDEAIEMMRCACDA